MHIHSRGTVTGFLARKAAIHSELGLPPIRLQLINSSCCLGGLRATTCGGRIALASGVHRPSHDLKNKKHIETPYICIVINNFKSIHIYI